MLRAPIPTSFTQQADHDLKKKNLEKITPEPQRNTSKRSHSTSRACRRKTWDPKVTKPVSPSKKPGEERRCRSWSTPSQVESITTEPSLADNQAFQIVPELDAKNLHLPHSVMEKISRILSIKKRDFAKLRKNFIAQQNMFLESYAQLREVEARAGVESDGLDGEVKVVTITGWPANDILLLVQDGITQQFDDINSICGSTILIKTSNELRSIADDVMKICTELMNRRLDIINVMRSKSHLDKIFSSNYIKSQMSQTKTKNQQFDEETKTLYKLVDNTVDNIRKKIDQVEETMKTPWIDREKLIKNIEKFKKENLILQTKLDSYASKETLETLPESDKKILADELAKERTARETLKELIVTAESMLRSARARISTMERQAKDIKAELEQTKKKHKEMEHLYRQRETNFDARSKKLIELSKSGEQTIETLSRQRDALEIRVKELLEQVEKAENEVHALEAEQRSRITSLQARVADQEKQRMCAEARVKDLEAKVKELVAHMDGVKERSNVLMDLDRLRYMEYIPSKEVSPGEREVEIYKELQATRIALSRTQEELRKSRADKDAFLNSLARIAHTGEDSDQVQEHIATELINKEKEIAQLRNTIEEHQENERFMEQDMTRYENQLASLRLEVKRLRNYDWYAKDLPYRELQTELLELQMKLETMTSERSALEATAISRGLMLERHERANDFFTRMIRARKELCECFEEKHAPLAEKQPSNLEVTKSLTLLCTGEANTWSSLRIEREHVRKLERIVVAQSAQLERDAEIRTLLEQQRAKLERAVTRRGCEPKRELGQYGVREDLSTRSTKSTPVTSIVDNVSDTDLLFNNQPFYSM